MKTSEEMTYNGSLHNGSLHQQLMTANEVSRYLGIPLEAVYQLSDEGKIQATEWGEERRYWKEDVVRFTHSDPIPVGSQDGPERFAEKRRFPRIICSIPSRFEVNIPQLKHCEGNGTICNLSRGGALLEINWVKTQGGFLQKEDPIRIDFDSAILRMQIVEKAMLGRIVRVHPFGKTKLGIEFDPLHPEVAEALASFIWRFDWTVTRF